MKPARGGSVFRENVDPADDPLRFGPGEIDREQAVLQFRSRNFHALGEQETALELAGRNAPVQVLSALVVELPAPDDQLVFLDRDIEFLTRETGNGERDAIALGMIVLALDPLDIVGRVAIGRRLGEAVHRPLDFIETEQERRRKIENARHVAKPSG